VHRTGAQLALHPPAGGQLHAGVDGHREPRLVDKQAVEAQALSEIGAHEVNVTRGVHPCPFSPKSHDPREPQPWIYARSDSADEYRPK
jgi:hypothetical protein